MNFTELSISRILEAAERTETPFYYYSGDTIRKRAMKLRKALPAGWGIYFAVKSNPNVEILRLFGEMDFSLETASAGEIEAAIRAGFDLSTQVSFSGPVKGDIGIKKVGSKRPMIVHAETFEELGQLNAVGSLKKRIGVALRINPDFKIDAGKGTAMIGGSEKFGFSIEDAEEALGRVKEYPNLDFKGFHVYFGTQILSAGKWLRSAGAFLSLVVRMSKKSGFRPSYINFGGGIGIPFTDGEKEFDLAMFSKGIKKMLREYDKEDTLKRVKYHIEPGRYLSGPAGVYVMKVEAVKKIRGQNFALTDGGIHHALFPYRVRREYPVMAMGKKRRAKSAMRRYVLGGPLCTTLDQSDLPALLPPLERGDIIGIFNSGAYGYSASLHFFLSHPLPAEILDDRGKYYMIRKPSEIGHIFANQTCREM